MTWRQDAQTLQAFGLPNGGRTGDALWGSMCILIETIGGPDGVGRFVGVFGCDAGIR
jgi:hypothetical protein